MLVFDEIPFLSTTPIGKGGSPVEIATRPRGAKGNAGF